MNYIEIVRREISPLWVFLVTCTLLRPDIAQTADVIAHPAHLQLQYHALNVDPEIVGRLSASRSVRVTAIGQPPGPGLTAESTQAIPAGSPSFSLEMEVEGGPSSGVGYSYGVSPLLLANQQYLIPALVSPPVRAGETPVLSFTDCPGLLDIRFVDRPGGSAVTVDRANLFVITEGQSVAHAVVYNVGGDGYKLLAHSGERLRVQTVYSRGSNPTVDRLTYFAEVRVTTPLGCDEHREVEIVVPAAAELGQIVGHVKMVGENEVPHDGAPYSMNTVMVADAPPLSDDFWANDRYTFFNHYPSSGSFVLNNLLPSETFVPWFGTGNYRVWGRMQFRQGRAVNFFRIPSLVGASRPVVRSGETVDLGDTFILRPGYVHGRVALRGPIELPGRPSALRHLRRLSDARDGEGNPVGGGWLMASHSSVEALGVGDYSHEGAGLTEFDGEYNPATGELAGRYELVLAGLKAQPSVWNVSRLNLAFNSSGSTDPYIAGNLRIVDRRLSNVMIEPGTQAARDLECCFGEVLVRFSAPEGSRIYQPSVGVRGEFDGADDQGNPASYRVETGPGVLLGTAVPVPFQGEPRAVSGAGQDGIVRLLLPQGTYTLWPTFKVLANGNTTELRLPAMTNVVVVCSDRHEMTTCLAVEIPTLPTCLIGPFAPVSGSVIGCNNVARLVWTRGDNVEHVICDECGLNPTFRFELPVANRCEDETFTVIAYPATGAPARLTRTIFADRIAPVISGPTNLSATCASPAGAVVDYVAAATDNCDLASFTCTPPSGATFPIGTTAVTCVARDFCGNEIRHLFTITVTGNCQPDGGCLTNQPNLLINGSFESPGIPDFYWALGSGDPMITGWKTLGAGVEYHSWLSRGTIYPVAAEAIAQGQFAIDLAGANGPAGIEQTFPSIPGQAYLVSFYLATSAERGRNGNASVRVSAADESRVFSMDNDTPFTYFTRHTMRFTARLGTTTTLSFTTTNDPAQAFVEIDDVQVTLDCPSQPPVSCLEIGCPTNIVVTASLAETTPVHYSAWATNSCGGPVDIQSDPPSGSLFPIGTTEVWVAVKGSGQTNRCRFTVTVLPRPNDSCTTNLLVNGSFESPGVPDGYVTLASGDPILTGWTPVLTGLEYFNPRSTLPPSVPPGAAADGNYAVDLTPVGGPGGGLQQSFATVVGRVYRVHFALGTAKAPGRSGRASLVATIAGRSYAFHAATDIPWLDWTQHSFTFIATAERTTLAFSSLDDPAVSFVTLDDVVVTDCCDAPGLQITPTISVEWQCGILQSASEATGPYVDIPGAVSPYNVPASGPRRFWRVRN